MRENIYTYKLNCTLYSTQKHKRIKEFIFRSWDSRYYCRYPPNKSQGLYYFLLVFTSVSVGLVCVCILSICLYKRYMTRILHTGKIYTRFKFRSRCYVPYVLAHNRKYIHIYIQDQGKYESVEHRPREMKRGRKRKKTKYTLRTLCFIFFLYFSIHFFFIIFFSLLFVLRVLFCIDLSSFVLYLMLPLWKTGTCPSTHMYIAHVSI